jgi:hypothetical protein
MQMPDMSCGRRLTWIVASCLTWVFVPNWVGAEMIAGILCWSEFRAGFEDGRGPQGNRQWAREWRAVAAASCYM